MTAPRSFLGRHVAPVRFIIFVVLLAIGSVLAIPPLGLRIGALAAFDGAALIFILSCLPLFGRTAAAMRAAAEHNDANRALLLVITGAVMLAVLAAVASELMVKDTHKPLMLTLIVASLATAWCFSNIVYALHYAHLFYQSDDGSDRGGLDFPGTKEPNYWDFVYFAFCLGMTFQTADVSMTTTRMRKVATAHCLAAFIFNLGIIAFTINVLGG